ncbi:isocitrate/isopropylmalate family dehydrogenase, partial [Klebsiella pneumoniae]
MATHKLLLLPGDGIGVETWADVERVSALVNKGGKEKFETTSDLVGGAAIDAHGVPVTDAA